MEQYKSLKSKAVLCGKGVAMGVADIIPGVSGGTIAFISGIYEHLIAAINSVRPVHALSFLKLILFFWHGEKRDEALKSLAEIQWGFLISLGTGIVSAILLMSRIVPYFLKTYPFYTYALFFGLIVASIPMIFTKMNRDVPSYGLLALFAVLMYLLMGDANQLTGSTALPYVFMSGALAICAMILPGISGSYILVLLGQYLIVLEALHNRDLLLLSVFICGIAVGIMSFTRFLKYLLSRHHSATMAALTGIMIGSLRAIWPGRHAPEAGVSFEALALAVAIGIFGGLLIFALNRFSQAVGDPEPPVSSAV